MHGRGGRLHNRLTPIAEVSLRGLHLRSIEDCGEISRLLDCARENRVVFHRGPNKVVDLELAQLERIEGEKLIFETFNFENDFRNQVFLNFNFERHPYFFAAT